LIYLTVFAGKVSPFKKVKPFGSQKKIPDNEINKVVNISD